jgi:FkbM family methyltransferase
MLRWNKNEKDFLYFLKLIPDGQFVLDIGANIGIMSVHLARKLKQSTIYAIEPIPNNLKALQRIIRFYHLNNIKVFDFALGNEEGKIEMVMPVVENVKMQGLSHVVHDSINDFNEGTKFNVEVKKLDKISEFNNGTKKISAIKMDVENFEFFVLDGGKKIIQKNRPIIYTELWENENREKCFSFIKELNYNIKVLNNKKLVDFEHGTHKTQNFFFIPK